MKALIIFFYTTLFIAVTTISCSKDNDGTSSYIRGKIDDIPFECTTNITANKPERIPPYDDPTLRINGEWSGHTIKIFLNELNASIVSGSYVIESGKNRSVTITENGNMYFASSGCIICFPTVQGSGRITITDISKKHVSGTFEFITDATSAPARKITNGEFSINRQ